MIRARSFQAATLLFDGSVLMTGGWPCDGVNTATNTAEIYIPSSGGFEPVGSMAAPRYCQSSTLLSDGTVLIAGGWGNSGSALSSAEIFTPSTISFSPTGSLNTARCRATATPLYDGTVLVAGGWGNSGGLASAEVYSPPAPWGTGTFATTGNMTTASQNTQTATLLNDGTVLVVVGANSGLASAELYSYPFTAGALNPKFIVLGVIYSPPGAKSTVSYSQTTALGASSSLSNGFQENISISGSLGFAGSGTTGKSKTPISGSGTGAPSTNWAQQADSSSTYTVNQTTTAGTGANGPLSSAIGVDHDYDKVLVWLNPKVNMSVGAITTDLLWSGYAFDSNDPYFTSDPDIVELSIYCLKNPFFAPDCTDNNYRTSRSWDPSGLGGLTLADYAQIASADPFYVNPLYDPNSDTNYRFTSTGLVAQFQPAAPGDGPTNWYGSWNFVATASDGESATNSYSTGFSIDAGIKFVLSADLKYSDTMTWTNKWSATQTYTVGQSALYSIYGPVATDNYTGPTAFEVWQDNVYGSFMFVAPGTTPTTAGSIGVSPLALNFGRVAEGQLSSPLQVTLTNNSVLPIFMGNPSAFPFNGTTTALSPVWAFSSPRLSVLSGSDACTGKILSPNGSCTISVQWTGSGTGTSSMTMYLTGVTDAVVLTTLPISGYSCPPHIACRIGTL